MKTTSRIFKLATPLLFVVGCGRPHQAAVVNSITNDIQKNVACESLHEKINETLTQALMDGKDLPTPAELENSLRSRYPTGSDRLIQSVLETYQVITTESKALLKPQTNDDFIAILVGLEIGDQSTPEMKSLKFKLHQGFAKVSRTAKSLGIQCAPAEVPNTPIEETPADNSADNKDNDVTIPEEDDVSSAARLPLPVQGAMRVMATAYQSCQAIRIPAMNDSTISVHPNAIKITGSHSSGTGLKRQIGDIRLLNQTHYYIREGSERGSSCFDVSKNPLIYDYGGKPSTSTADTSSLDLFKNSGSGTSVLGIDCSGYIFSSLAVTGLRLAPGKKMKAYLVHGVNARMYMNPSSNGLSCMAPVVSQKGSSLLDGDILASTGHIVMIEGVGADPFGLSRIRSVSSCTTDQISYQNFDFNIVHSAPNKNGIGINKSRASYYLAENTSMRTALLAYAVAACKAGFGQTSTIKPSTARLVRHKQTSECKDTPVTLERESCVRSCLANL